MGEAGLGMKRGREGFFPRPWEESVCVRSLDEYFAYEPRALRGTYFELIKIYH